MVQELVVCLIKLPEVLMGPPLKHVKVPLNVILSICWISRENKTWKGNLFCFNDQSDFCSGSCRFKSMCSISNLNLSSPVGKIQGKHCLAQICSGGWDKSPDGNICSFKGHFATGFFFLSYLVDGTMPFSHTYQTIRGRWFAVQHFCSEVRATGELLYIWSGSWK